MAMGEEAGLNNIDEILKNLEPEAEEQMKLLMDSLKGQLLTGGGGGGGNIAPGYSINPWFYFAAFLILFGVIGSFGYKLVKSLSDKDRKREEKRKLKEQRSRKTTKTKKVI